MPKVRPIVLPIVVSTRTTIEALLLILVSEERCASNWSSRQCTIGGKRRADVEMGLCGSLCGAMTHYIHSEYYDWGWAAPGLAEEAHVQAPCARLELKIIEEELGWRQVERAI